MAQQGQSLSHCCSSVSFDHPPSIYLNHGSKDLEDNNVLTKDADIVSLLVGKKCKAVTEFKEAPITKLGFMATDPKHTTSDRPSIHGCNPSNSSYKSKTS
ncbi:hypothetical protein IV203_010279 [Nitzschia inconspicua]|uniref:Uncharacterized protein n=1 Tax=Nitzschia inconspicua TaxID=303405 RepID=A0A9K3KWY2_9STRA|nr:hypothetical protein IV203_010279 [Nitzschia inconspicua]